MTHHSNKVVVTFRTLTLLACLSAFATSPASARAYKQLHQLTVFVANGESTYLWLRMIQLGTVAGERNPNFAAGRVQAIDGTTIVTFNKESTVQRVEVTSATRVWKGQDTTMEAIRPGDFFYARGEPTQDGRFIAETIWVNIMSLDLQITDIQADRIVFTDPHGPIVGYLQPYTVVIHDPAPISHDLSGLQTGQYVHVIGTWRLGTDEFDVSKIFY